MDVTLPFWVIMRSGRRNVMNHIASRGTIFGRSFVGVRGFFLPWVILQRERHHDHIWIFEHSIFLWRQFRVGVMPRNGKWVCLWPYMVPSFPPWVFGVHKMSPSYLLTTDIKQIQNLLSQASNWSRSLKKVIKRRKGLVLDVL
jgi:hypothetical protein